MKATGPLIVMVLLVGVLAALPALTAPGAPANASQMGPEVRSEAGSTLAGPVGGLTVSQPTSPGAAPTPQAQGFYTVFFKETGLPTGLVWSATLNGSTAYANAGRPIEFDGIPNGSYSYGVAAVNGYAPSLPFGNLKVNGVNFTRSETFTSMAPPEYALTVTETGLESGTQWSATVNGSTELSVTNTIVFDLPNATYLYSIGPVRGYGLNTSFGTVTVNGGPANVAVAFTPPVDYVLTIVETGLKAGTAWFASVNGTTQFSTGDYIDFSLPNGNYTFGIGSVNGYNVNPSFGTVRVDGSATSVSITFSSITFLGLVPAEGYAVLAALVAIVVVVALGLLLFLYRRWRRGVKARPPPRPYSPPPTASPPPASPPPTTHPPASSPKS